MKNRQEELKILLCKIYEDNVFEKISDSQYKILSDKYDVEQREIETEINAIQETLSQVNDDKKNSKKFIELMSKYDDFDELTPIMPDELIEKIIVHEREVKG